MNFAVVAQEDTLANANYEFVPSPIIIETVIGNNGVNVESLFSKKFTPTNRFGVFGIVDAYGVHETKMQMFKNQLMTQAQVTFTLVRGLDISAGAFFEKKFWI